MSPLPMSTKYARTWRESAWVASPGGTACVTDASRRSGIAATGNRMQLLLIASTLTRALHRFVRPHLSQVTSNHRDQLIERTLVALVARHVRKIRPLIFWRQLQADKVWLVGARCNGNVCENPWVLRRCEAHGHRIV